MNYFLVYTYACLIWIGVIDSRASIKIPSVSERLKAQGVDISQIEKVKEAARSGRESVRVLSVRYLASQKEELKDYLSDSSVRVRTITADLMADAGRNDGLTVMIADYSKMVTGNMDRSAEDFLQWRAVTPQSMGLSHTLEVGEVLAKLGDFRGMKLATVVLCNSKLGGERISAMKVLSVILAAKDGPKEEAKRTLIECLRHESVNTVISLLIANMEKVGNKDALDILEAIGAEAKEVKMKARIEAAVRKVRAR